MSKYKDSSEDTTVNYTEGGGNQLKYFNAALKYNNEFYKDEDNIEQKIINIKRIKLRKGEDWEILENKKVVLILKGIRFNNKEKEFFRTLDGVNFIMNGYKNGWDSVLKFKTEVKKII